MEAEERTAAGRRMGDGREGRMRSHKQEARTMKLMARCSGCPSPGRLGPHAYCTMRPRKAGSLSKCVNHSLSPY